MGEAARRRRLVSVIIPERGRPEMLDRCVSSLLDTAADDHIEIVVGVDEDDPAWRDRQPFGHSRTRYLRRPRPPTLGEKLNLLAKETRGDLILWLANDQVMETRGWPARCREAAARMPRDVGIAYLRDPLHPHHASYWMLTRRMTEAGFFSPPWFPYWFGDTWWTEVGYMSGLLFPIDAEISAPDGRGKTHAMVDLPFWVEVFQGTRPMRVRDAIQIAEEAYGKDSDRLKDMAMGLEQARQWCIAASQHLSSPAFLDRWGETAESEPAPDYAEVRATGEKLLAEVRAQEPRRPKVTICCPSGETWKATTGNSLAALAAYSAMAGVDVNLLNVQMSSVAHVRNTTVELSLKQGTDYLLWIDSDMKFPPDSLVRLLAHNRPIVGALYNKKFPHPETGRYETLGRLKGSQPEGSLTGLHEALMLPGGLVLVRAEVYQSMEAPYYFESYSFGNGDGLQRFKNLLCAYFSRVPPDEVLEDLGGTKLGAWIRDHNTQGDRDEMYPYLSEDLNWCRKARRCGWTLWADLDLTYEVAHLGTSTITCLKPEG